MKKKIYSIVLATIMGSVIFVACDSGSEGYMSAKKSLKECEKNIKAAKTCIDLEKAVKKYNDVSMSENSGASVEEQLRLLEYQEEIANLINEKSKKLCNE